MKVGRNNPCPCGSGRKYKKCCLEKDQAALVASSPITEATQSDEEPATNDWEESETSEEVEPVEPPNSADDLERPPLREYPRIDQNLPDLFPEDELLIKDWWKQTDPCYEKRDADQMIKRLETALTEFPSLFVHLGLESEFLFDLGSELGRRGRMPEYIALLQRLRREQRQMYSFSYGAFDSDVIAELVIAGQLEEIPAYLDLFKQYPDAQPDYCDHVCNLLAWRGHAEPLYLLCEAVATPMLTSAEVIGGDFTLSWLIRREVIPFYDGGDTSPGALEKTADAIRRLGERIQYPLKPDTEWLGAGLAACIEPPRVGSRGTLGDQEQRRIGLNFASHLRRTRQIPWVQAFLLSNLLQDYLARCRKKKIPWLRLQKQDIEAFAVCRARAFFCINGVITLAIIQGMVWFAEYLEIASAISATQAKRIKNDCRQLFDAASRVVDSTDPAYRICPTFEQLTELTAS